jgi:hypothetical protein
VRGALETTAPQPFFEGSDVARNDAFDHLEKALRRVRLGEDGDGPPTVLGSKSVVRWGCGHEHDARREVGPPVFDSTVEIFTRHPRHVQIGQDDIVAAMGEHLKRFPPALDGIDIVAVPPQCEVEQFPRIGFILNDQDAVGHSFSTKATTTLPSMGVSMGPGATAFTVIAWEASSKARHLVNMRTPALETP